MLIILINFSNQSLYSTLHLHIYPIICLYPIQTLTSINTILEKADKKYKQLVNHKNELDLLLRCVSNEGGVSVSSTSLSAAAAVAAGSTGVNKSIQVSIAIVLNDFSDFCQEFLTMYILAKNEFLGSQKQALDLI